MNGCFDDQSSEQVIVKKASTGKIEREEIGAIGRGYVDLLYPHFVSETHGSDQTTYRFYRFPSNSLERTRYFHVPHTPFVSGTSRHY